MRVNSAFTGFFTHRLVVGTGIAIAMFAIFFIAASFTEHSRHDLPAKNVNLIIRQIGDRLLLQAGDSTSRVLPVTEIKEGTFLLRFEKEFVFNHDSLMFLTQTLLPKTQFPSGYTVTVYDCVKGDIVYGFQINNTLPDILACKGRSQPSGCYTIEFDLPDFYANVQRKKAGIGGQNTSVTVDPQEVNPKPGKAETTNLDYDSYQRTAALTSVTADSQQVNPTLKESNKTIFHSRLINVVGGGILVLLGATLLIGRYRKILKPVTAAHQNNAVINESVPELPALGEFFFNVKGQRLLLNSEVISLTDKECKVLELLHKNFGELIPRQTLMQEVWINEGVITGRSLDMFISKLRKKLSVDPDLRITNIHGKGYRLETVNHSTAS